MNKEDKELLIRDLCSRLQYGVVVQVEGKKPFKLAHIHRDAIPMMKPYLRPIKSITDAEWADCVRSSNISYDGSEQHCIVTALMADARARWYDKHMFDHRGLLPKGLAIEMPKEMYKS